MGDERRRRVRRTLCSLAIVGVAGACGSPDAATQRDSAPPSATSLSPSVQEPVVTQATTTAVALESEVTTGSAVTDDSSMRSTPARSTNEVVAIEMRPSQVDLFDAGTFSGALEVTKCAWTGVAQFRLTFDWSPATPETVELPVEFAVIVGDQGTLGYAGVMTLDRRGTYTTRIDSRPLPSNGDDLISVGRNGLLDGRSGSCVLWTPDGVERNDDNWLQPVIEPDTDVAWPAGSLEALAAAVDVTDVDDPLLPLPAAVFGLIELPIDRWYLAPDERLERLSVRERGSCLRLRTIIAVDDDGDDWVEVEQSRGCVPWPASDGSATQRVDDPNWSVIVTGQAADVARVAASLRDFRLTGVEPVSGPPELGADAYFAGYVDEYPEFEVVARLPWRDGEVAVLRNTTLSPEWAVGEWIYYGDEAWPGGGVGTSCLEYSWFVSDYMGEGFGWFVSPLSTHSVMLPVRGNGSFTVGLEPTSDGWGAVLIDVAEVGYEEGERSPLIVDSNGSPVPCTQNGETNLPDPWP